MKNLICIFSIIFLSSCLKLGFKVPEPKDNNNDKDVEGHEETVDLDVDTDDTEVSDKIEDVDCDDINYNDRSDVELPDIDRLCPSAGEAGYPYFEKYKRRMHFCRPCDTPDEYDPQCIKSLWKEINKASYDKYLAGGFENNEFVKECYPWPCRWDVEPTPHEESYYGASKCDLIINPHRWNFYTNDELATMGSMNNGYIGFVTDNNDMDWSLGEPYSGDRAVIYNVKEQKYTVIAGNVQNSTAINSKSEMLTTVGLWEKRLDEYYNHKMWVIYIKPYKDSYRYQIAFSDSPESKYNLRVLQSTINDKWAVMVIDRKDPEGHKDLIYAKVGEWNWKSIVYEKSYYLIKDLALSNNKIMFVHSESEISYMCDLALGPKGLGDCKRIGKDDEVVWTPIFDKDNPDIIAYNTSGNRTTIVDTSKEPWEFVTAFNIMFSEPGSYQIDLMEKKSNLILYLETYRFPSQEFRIDKKICFFRMDKEEKYCSKLNPEYDYFMHGKAQMHEKYLFWESKWTREYVLRDMDCYCREEGVCPFEE